MGQSLWEIPNFLKKPPGVKPLTGQRREEEDSALGADFWVWFSGPQHQSQGDRDGLDTA